MAEMVTVEGAEVVIAGVRLSGAAAWKLSEALRSAAHQAWTEERRRESEAQRATDLAAGGIEIDGVIYLLGDDLRDIRSHRQPPRWPVRVPFRARGGRTIHAWQGGGQSVCDRASAWDAERVTEDDPRPRCKRCWEGA